MARNKPTPEEVQKQKEDIASKKLEKKRLKDLKMPPQPPSAEDQEKIKSGELKPVAAKPEKFKPLPNYINTKQIATIDAKYILTTEEKNAAGNELAHREKQLQQIEMDKKDRMAAFKAQADEVKAQIAELSNKVTLGYEYRKFRTVKHLDFIRKVRIYKEHDTDVTIEERAIEPDDYQLRLPI